jgi:hypothetical protein
MARTATGLAPRGARCPLPERDRDAPGMAAPRRSLMFDRGFSHGIDVEANIIQLFMVQ